MACNLSKMQELIQEGMSNLCRLCGEDDRECFDLFDDERQEEELLLKIEQSIRIAVSNLVSFLMVLNDSKVRLRLVESIGVQVSCFQLKLSDMYCVSDFPLTYSFDFFFFRSLKMMVCQQEFVLCVMIKSRGMLHFTNNVMTRKIDCRNFFQ